jgi:rhodanese-related sulfurtransferase
MPRINFYIFIRLIPFVMRYITPLELKQKLDSHEPVQVIDTRDPIKFQECHIEGSINIPQIDIPDSLDRISTEGVVVICCLYGLKSEAPYLYLREKQGRKNVVILEGGLYQWAADIDQTMVVY